MTVTNCEESELFLNGRSLGRKKSDLTIQCEWLVEYKSGKLVAKGYNDSKEVVCETVQTTDVPYKIELDVQMPEILNDGCSTVPVWKKTMILHGHCFRVVVRCLFNQS